MIRVGCIGLICIALCAGGIALARRIGGTHVSPLAIIFTMPDGTPCPEVCLFGVQPGKTSYEQAYSLLQQHPVTRMRWRRAIGSAADRVPADIEVLFANSQDSDGLMWIMVMNVNPDLAQTSSATGTLGGMISLLGPPSVVEVNIPARTSALFADNRIEIVSVRAGMVDSAPLSIYDSLSSISLYAPGGRNEFTNPQFRQWRGFRQIEGYRNAPLVNVSP